jgi:hypothetical protein
MASNSIKKYIAKLKANENWVGDNASSEKSKSTNSDWRSEYIARIKSGAAAKTYDDEQKSKALLRNNPGYVYSKVYGDGTKGKAAASKIETGKGNGYISVWDGDAVKRNNPGYAYLQQAGGGEKLTKGSDAISAGDIEWYKKILRGIDVGLTDFSKSLVSTADVVTSLGDEDGGPLQELWYMFGGDRIAEAAGDNALGIKGLNFKDNPIKAFNKLGEKEIEYRQKRDAAYADNPLYKYSTATSEAAAMMASTLMGGGLATAVDTAALANAARIGQAASKLSQTGAIAQNAIKQFATRPDAQVIFGSSFGSSYDEAKQDGADDLQALVYAALNGAGNAVTELGGVSELGGLQKLPEWVKKAVNKGDKSLLLNYAKSIGEEASEEIIQGILGRGLKSIYSDVPLYDANDENSIINPKAALEEATGAAVVSTLLGLPTTGINAAYRAKQRGETGQRLYGNSQRELVDEGLESERGTKSYELARKYDEKLNNGKQLSGNELYRLAQANEKAQVNEGTAVQSAPETQLNKESPALPHAALNREQQLSELRNYVAQRSEMSAPVNTNVSNNEAVSKSINNVAAKIDATPEFVSRVYNLNPVESPEAFEMAFDAVYQMGQQGANKESLTKVPVLNRAQAEIAYNMGASTTQAAVDNAAAQGDNVSTQVNNQINTQEVNNNGVRLRDSGQRLNGQNTEGQIPSVERGTVEAYAGTDSGRQSGYSAAQGKTEQKVVYNGVEQENVYYSGEDTESMKKGRELAKSYGYNVTYFEGGNIKDSGGEFRGMVDTESKTVMVRSDHPDISAEQIMRHEMGHAAIAQGDISLDELRSAMLSDLSEKELNSAVEVYRHAYGDTISEAEAFEEMCCDALGKINIFAGTEHDSANYGKVQESFRKHTAETANKGRAPPKSGVMFSRQAEDKYFARQIDQWDGKDHGGAFRVGGVSDPLLKVGIPNTDIWFDQSKAAKQLLEKGEITKSVIKQIPEILQHPIAISESYDNTVMVFGQVFDANGNPIVVALRVNSTKRRNSITLVNKIRSVGSRSHNLDKLLNDSNILYLGENKKETKAWFNALGRSTPFGGTKFGLIRSVSFADAAVKKFSMEAPIEQKKNLIALHNLDETKLLKTLKLGGFPMPSIAITKSDIPHTNFGNITVVFGKETVDPKFDRRNTVYSADAWTPLFPRMEYEANEKAAQRIRRKYYELEKKHGHDFVSPLYESANYLDDTLTKYGGVEGLIDKFADDTRMMQIYLADTGRTPVESVKTETITRLTDNQIEVYDALINTLGADVLNDMAAKHNEAPFAARKAWFAKHGDALKAAFEQYYTKDGIDAKTAKSVVDAMKPAELIKEATNARKYLKDGAETRKTEVDIDATNIAIRKAVDSGEYIKWLNDLYGDAVKDSGFYNNKDYYTSSGNRRSFKATHYPNTLDGIVKAMASQGDGNSRNVMGFHGVKSLRAGTAERFKSVEDMHKLEGRLKHLTAEEASQISDALDSRLSELMHDIYNLVPHSGYSNELMELDSIGEVFMEATELKYVSPANVKALFKKYNYPLTDKMASDIVALLFDVNNMPVNIFEAKPERVVGFDEIRKVIIPDTSSDTLRKALKEAGINAVEEYRAGDDAARMKIANDVPDAHFSREPESITELRRQNETMLAQATNEDAANENERGLIKDYKRQYDKVSGIAEKLDAARQEVLTAESSGDKNAIATARNRFTLLSRKYAEEHRKLSDYVNIKALDNVLTRVKDRTAENSLPEGMGAASAEFTGEETRGERWVTEAQGKGNNALHPISREQEANLAEQQHRAPQEIPKEDLNGKLTSKHVSTLANSGVTPAEFSDALREDAAQGKFSHIAYSDEAALKKAEITIEANGWEQALADYKAQINAGKVSKDNTVMGIALYNNAVNSGDYATALDIASLMVKNSTNTAQSLQAMRILNKLSPECKLYLAAKSVETIEEDLNEKYKDNKADIHVDKVLYDEYGKALRSGDEDGIKTAWAKIEQSVAQQIDATWYEKLNNFRYLAMLGNPRTHVRNIVGNAFFVPVRAVKNTIAYGLENVADSKVNGGIERSKAMLNRNNANDVALIKYAMTDYEAMQETILSGGKYVDTFQGIDKKRTIYKTKILEAARKGNSNLLDAEDAWFCKPAYANALAKWYKANGITAEQLNTGKVPESTIIKAQTVAVKEAQKATYRDTNRFSAMVSRLGKVDNKIASALIEGVLPFKKTPANILVRAVEYSPVGLIKSLAVDTKKVKAYVNGDVENGMSPAQFIDDVSAGLTGTALVGLGILLASWGLFSGSPGDDDKQNKFDELGGSQNYALNIGGLSITLDWLAPESMPLFVGVELYNSLSGKSEDNGFVQNLMSSVMSLSTPMFEMSMLQSVNDLFDNLAYIKQGQGSFKIVTSMATNYISQYFPTLFGQAERAFGENQRETTYIDRNSNVGSELQYMWGKIANKIPFYDFSQIPYIDAWGRTEETGNLFERVLNNFVNPAYVKKERSTEIDGELKRLYDLGETGVYPGRAAVKTKINGEFLTAEEYVKYATVRGRTSYDLAKKIINSSAYSRASDAEKAYMLSYVYKYADQIAKYEVNNEYDKVYDWQMAAYKSSNPAQGIIDHAQEYYKRKENDES